jgi:DNA-damage-inducible protein D
MEKRIAAEGEGNRLAIFEGSEIRRILVDGKWYYSVVDIIKALTDSDNPRNYWSMLKSRELENGI